LIQFDLDRPDLQVFDGFHAKLQERIRNTPEWHKHSKQQPAMATTGDDDDDVPF
jgi:hypothetical protein